ncbi:MAG TPA: selenocysteine-specific translation elongation factor [Candidatus Binatus sp.]|uniref:selenocysteine-specific translation elongation factor n=1 Tax=Candidatus Binatus sp. TaxID=2811406 RepID=UPI002B4A343A|nr:selenocysteine-specific translation elongation factor [Candidatus Binatus sp.]HKN13680.1 selenocysteine-specific translation elongation factor [Candidatus Binatus sp.]
MASTVTHAIIGTAGHIDHGKTALIKALTGLDTDRLKEEKERGISIDLGFAYFTLPDATRAGIVDVPGHERFIRNMLAGAHGIDLVLFTIAADDGVMPQTEEHLDILHLLGTRRGIFVITKSDLADAARIRDVRDEIELLADGTTLAGAPVIEVSSVNGLGLDTLRAEIVRQLDGFQARRATGVFRLPLDRAFVIKGHGIVVTGTAMGAEVRVGQKLSVLPSNNEVRVRSIQVHSDSVESAGLCQRVALNLTGAEKLELARGDVLADERLDSGTARFDAWLEIRPAAKRALKSNTRVRLFVGTAETIARAIVLDDASAIAPKASGFAQLVTEDPVVALSGDRFVIRDETNSRTLGGGVVLNPLGRRVRKPIESYRANLRMLRDSSGADALEAFINLQESFALGPTKIATLMNIPDAEAEAALREAKRFIKLSIGDEEAFTTRTRWETLKRFVLDALEKHHKAEPLSPGLEMEALRTRLPYEIGARAFRPIVDRLSHESEIVREESVVRMKSHRVQLGGDAETLGAKIEAALTSAHFQPPELKQLAEALKLPANQLPHLRTVLLAMERQDRVVKIATDLYFSRAAADTAKDRLVKYLETHPEITAATFRDLLGASRKFAIALLDHFDHVGVTTRVGDTRRLRLPKPSP